MMKICVDAFILSSSSLRGGSHLLTYRTLRVLSLSFLGLDLADPNLAMEILRCLSNKDGFFLFFIFYYLYEVHGKKMINIVETTKR